MRTTAVGDRRSRVPPCGRRYADAPAAFPLTARGGGECPPSCARQSSTVADARRTAVYTPFFLERRLSPARMSNADMAFDHIALSATASISATRRQLLANISSAAPPHHPIDSLLGREQMRNMPPRFGVQGTDECIDVKRCHFRPSRSHCASRRREHARTGRAPFRHSFYR